MVVSLSLRLYTHCVWTQAVKSKKRKRKEGPEPHQRQNATVDVSARIRISKILENFLASKDEGLAHLECS